MSTDNLMSEPALKIASNIPGRLRLRLAEPRRSAALFQHIGETLKAQEHVKDIKVNPHTGSVLIHYDSQALKADGITRIVAQAVHPPTYRADVPDEQLEDEAKLLSSFATVLLKELGKASVWLSKALGMKIDLRFLVPVGFAAVGLSTAATQGLGLESLPPLLFLWIAYDSYTKIRDSDVRDRLLPALAPAQSGS